MTDFIDVLKAGAGGFIAILIAALFFRICTVLLIDSGLVPWMVSHIVLFFRRMFRRRTKTEI